MTAVLRDWQINGQGLLEETWVDDADGKVTVRVVQDCSEVLDHNAQICNHGRPAAAPRDFRPIAEIPVVVVELWKNTLGVDIYNPDHADAVRKLLDDGGWRRLRTSDCVIGK